MKYYLAPLEGITQDIFRSTYHKYFSPMDKYFTPFLVSPNFSTKEKNDLDPAHNEGMITVPQVLTNQASEFLAVADSVSRYGYDVLNLNLGCPSGTVVSKRRGAGFLWDPEQLDKMLYEIFDKSKLKISIKTRIGVADSSEWEDILEVYAKYDMEELIIHPRLQKQFYKETPDISAFKRAMDDTNLKLCYNGDICSKADLDKVLNICPDTDTIMIGRGILKNPGLMASLRGEVPPTKETIIEFHNELLDRYTNRMSGDVPVIYKMIELWTYLGASFTNSDKYFKKIKKARKLSDYKIAATALFRDEDYIPLQ